MIGTSTAWRAITGKQAQNRCAVEPAAEQGGFVPCDFWQPSGVARLRIL